jgi:hypothetical protein
MTDPMNDITTAEREARAHAAWLNAHGYEASVWTFCTALDNYGPESRRTSYARGYAVRYAGRLVRDDGSRADFPTAGITVYCQDDELPLGRLLAAGRALVTFGAGDSREYGPYEPYFVASWNPRKTGRQLDQDINPGILPSVILHKLTPLAGSDGPKRFYDLRLSPASDLATGTRVRVIAAEPAPGGDTGGYDPLFIGQQGVIRHPHYTHPMVQLDPVYDPVADTTRPYGQLRQFSRASLEPVTDEQRYRELAGKFPNVTEDEESELDRLRNVLDGPWPPEGTCILTGEPGEDPDDCTTHWHEH